MRPLGARAFVLAMLVVAALGGDVHAASKSAVALLGDPAPGGGVFAGPGFTGWPAAAGNGWVAFRGQVSGGTSNEALVVARMVPPATRSQVASVGAPAPGGGKFRQFVGRPVVNANGDVAFLAQLTSVSGADDDPSVPTPAGIFLFRGNALAAVARSGQSTPAGKIDLLAPTDPNADPNDEMERTPALNDAGDVAFLAAIRDDPHSSGGIFLARVGREAAPIVRIGDRYDGGTFSAFGPPALNGRRTLAFHGMVATTNEPNEGVPDGILEGVFTAGPDGAPPALLVSEGTPVMPLDQRVYVFGDDVALNDAGDVVFLAGPLSGDVDAVGALANSPGIVVYAGGVLTAVGYPGLQAGANRITSFRLGPAAGSLLVPPVITPDGHVAFLASLDSGVREAIVVWDGVDFRLILTGGLAPDPTPAGGVYAGASSAPALDAAGGLAFRARIAGGVTSEALVYQPADGPGVVTVVGDGTPSSGFFAGQPFSPPVMNDAGDVVFRAFLARTSASVGVFRRRQGTLEAVVRSGDPAPGLTGDRFLDLVGQPRLNQRGTVAFVGQIPSRGLGIYVADEGGIRPVVVSGDPAPDDDRSVFKTISPQPALNDAGAVAFRATTVRFDPLSNDRVTRDGIFIADAGGIRRIVGTRDASPAREPFFRLRDPVLTNLPSVAFRASVGVDEETATGVFVADANGIHQIALEKEDLGAGITLSRVTGDPSTTSTGDLAFLATRTRQLNDAVSKPLGPSILRSTVGGLGLVVAQDMPGPAGGTFRNLSIPAVNSLGHVAFRGSFLPFTGGIGGIFLATERQLEAYLTNGEAASGGGRLTSYGGIALNAHDDIACTATITGGASRAGVFVASRTRLAVRRFALRLARGGTRGRIRVSLALRLGRLAEPVEPTSEPVTVTVSDAHGVLWSVTVNPSLFQRRGPGLVAVPRAGGALARKLISLRLRVDRDGTPIVRAASRPLDLGAGGDRSLTAPFAVTLQVGDDSGIRALPCPAGRRGVRCRAV